MKLFIANLTKQHQIFLYRVLEESVPGGHSRHQDIAIGTQVMLPSDFSTDQINAIIDHQKLYGIKSVEEAQQIKGFTGLVYSIGKPVQLNDEGFVKDVLHHNDDTLTDRANDRRETTAAAITSNMQQLGRERGAPLQRTEVEQVEETTGTPQVAAGIETVVDNVAPRNQGTRKGSK